MKKQFSTVLSLMTFVLGMSSAAASVENNTAIKPNIMSQSSTQNTITYTDSRSTQRFDFCPFIPGDSRGDPCFDFGG